MRFTRALFFISILYAFTRECYGQLSAGATFGASLNFPRGTSAHGDFKTSPALGYSLGLRAAYQLHRTSIQSGLYYVTKNYRVARTSTAYPIFQDVRNAYLQVPLQLTVCTKEKKKLLLHAGGGGFAGYWLASHIKGRIPNILDAYTTTGSNGQLAENIPWQAYEQSYVFNKKRDNRVEAGILLSAGMQYSINKKIRLSADGSFQRSCTSMQKPRLQRNAVQVNRTILFTGALIISLD